MLQLPTVEQSTSRASVCLPAGSAKKKVTRTSAKFETMFEWLYDEKMKESTRRLRLIRRVRSKDCTAVWIFFDAIDAIKQSHYADRKLEEKKAKLPDNQKMRRSDLMHKHQGHIRSMLIGTSLSGSERRRMPGIPTRPHTCSIGETGSLRI